MLSLDAGILEYPVVAIDLETSGAYPLDSEICEIAAVKFHQGKVIDTFQTLVKISHPMPPEIEKIHGISDSMLVDAPGIQDVIGDVFNFIDKSVIIGHHIQFDLGFLAVEFEKYLQKLPHNLIFCTSLLSRNLIAESPNHRLQTLIEFLGLTQGVAHRALDDSKACFELFLRCIERLEDDAKLSELQEVQEFDMQWIHYSMDRLKETSVGANLIEAVIKKERCFINYKSPRNKDDNYREVIPKGLVLSSRDNFLSAYCLKDFKDKRFYVEKIQEVKFASPF